MNPTTWLTILGGTESENDWGDPIEGTTELHARVPAELHERPVASTSDEGQREPVTIVFVTALIPNRYNVTNANRARDVRTGDTYLIDHVTKPQPGGYPQETRLDLRRVS